MFLGWVISLAWPKETPKFCQAYISIFNYDLAPPIYLQKFGTAQLKLVMTDAKVSYQGVSRISILTSKLLVDKATE